MILVKVLHVIFFRSWAYTVYLRIVNAQATWASKRENQETFKYLVDKYDDMTEVMKKNACMKQAWEMRQRCQTVVVEMENSGYNTELHKEKNAQQAQRKKDRKEFEGWELPDPLTVLPGTLRDDLFPFHSPLLRESQLFSFPGLINMLNSARILT